MIASSGQASTQKPQYTQRRRAISKRVGYFSMSFSARSPASMKMHSAGHTVAHM